MLNDGEDFANVRSTFAGGLLEGAQYNPNTNRFEAVVPSGEFTDNPLLAQPITDGDDDGGGGAFTLSELMEFEAALRGANFGNFPTQSIFSQFEDKGKGTYDIRRPKEGSPVPYSGMFQGALHLLCCQYGDALLHDFQVRTIDLI